MKSAQLLRGLLAVLVVLVLSVPASAAVTLLEKDGMSVTTDAFFNTFYVYSSSDKNDEMIEKYDTEDRDQSRVKMGFLPNYIGFNFSKQLEKMKVGGRSSFWVTINDNGKDDTFTETGIDVRQFYGTIDGDWGQLLLGKDFGLFCRSNIFLDEILLGYGNVSDTQGLIDGSGVSFGNITSGYIYPLPNAQITYRSPVLAGFRLAVGIFDPGRTSDPIKDDSIVGGEEEAPQFQGELTYNYKFDKGEVTAWAGFLQQVSEETQGGDEVDSEGVSYGLQAKYAGLSLHASGFDASGVGVGAGPNISGNSVVDTFGDEVDSNGYLLQASYTFGPHRLVASYGESEIDDSDWENETTTGAYYYTFNDYLKVAAEYNVNKISIGKAEEETDTIAIGGIISF